MEQLIRIGLDTSKRFFQLHGVDAAERPVLRRQLRRSEVIGFFSRRGHAAEFGIVAAKGRAQIPALLQRVQRDEVPELARALFADLADEYAGLEARIAQIDARLKAWYKDNETARRLADIPGVGPLIASLLVMKTPDSQAFRSGRDYAAWLGLTPRDHSTAGKARPGRITRAGDPMLAVFWWSAPRRRSGRPGAAPHARLRHAKLRPGSSRYCSASRQNSRQSRSPTRLRASPGS